VPGSQNIDGVLYALTYDKVCSANPDPIEKKPLFHFQPGSSSFSIATMGCNFRCAFCQNWEISQVSPEDTYNYELPPERVVDLAKKAGSRSIAYTYVEPTIFYEYMLACAKAGREAGLYSAVISAGFIEPEPLQELCRAVDAIKIDLKGFSQEFYASLDSKRPRAKDKIRFIAR
jgi:pyruvate formate lyase activating enzyme